ncbi:hypothetical protein KC19_6G225500 [Ceratodon purpureus]|uniref:Uncharacterized protein n=1 Tax=Ceratodon purpureus TaxID=3225 RepID=A0A8T0HKF6_CERPU|nr:hypothetical protein KC19_6G225500 [Ceratodon purpureus]
MSVGLIRPPPHPRLSLTLVSLLPVPVSAPPFPEFPSSRFPPASRPARSCSPPRCPVCSPPGAAPASTPCSPPRTVRPGCSPPRRRRPARTAWVVALAWSTSTSACLLMEIKRY